MNPQFPLALLSSPEIRIRTDKQIISIKKSNIGKVATLIIMIIAVAGAINLPQDLQLFFSGLALVAYVATKNNKSFKSKPKPKQEPNLSSDKDRRTWENYLAVKRATENRFGISL
ncbi:MAG: hypothetical protein OHK0017_08170 [Patescibacteria group bacterium]